MDKQYPLIIVFYLDAELMKEQQVINRFAESINMMLVSKEANAIALFLPTKGEERVECINPVIMAEADMVKINQMVEDIKKSFDIGASIDLPDEEITIDDNSCTCNGADCECKNVESND